MAYEFQFAHFGETGWHIAAHGFGDCCTGIFRSGKCDTAAAPARRVQKLTYRDPLQCPPRIDQAINVGVCAFFCDARQDTIFEFGIKSAQVNASFDALMLQSR